MLQGFKLFALLWGRVFNNDVDQLQDLYTCKKKKKYQWEYTFLIISASKLAESLDSSGKHLLPSPLAFRWNDFTCYFWEVHTLLATFLKSNDFCTSAIFFLGNDSCPSPSQLLFVFDHGFHSLEMTRGSTECLSTALCL